MRIWVQSMTDITRLPGYSGLMRERAKRVCSPDTIVELHGVRAGTYPDAMPPVEAARYRWIVDLVSAQFVENAMRAQRGGFDAFAMSCFGDPGLDACRSVVEIPVVSSFQTSLLVASLVGKAFGLLTVDEPAARRARDRIRSYGYSDSVATVVSFPAGFDEYVLDRAFNDGSAFLTQFEGVARQALAAGADVIIPAEGVLNTLLVRKGVSQFGGAPVLDSFGALMSLAEMMVRLRAAGLSTSRIGAYARPPQTLLAHLRASTAAALEDSGDS